VNGSAHQVDNPVRILGAEQPELHPERVGRRPAHRRGQSRERATKAGCSARPKAPVTNGGSHDAGRFLAGLAALLASGQEVARMARGRDWASSDDAESRNPKHFAHIALGCCGLLPRLPRHGGALP
jgi:hypothetical protein